MDESRGLSCLVCYNAFSSMHDSNIPRNLTCGHTFCTACLERLSQQCHGLYVQCPTCKCQTLLQHANLRGIKSLPKNFGVLEIIECREGKQLTVHSPDKTAHKEKHKDKTRHNCEEHDEAKKVYCYTDECLICIYCQIYGKHQGHKCELASDLAKSSRSELKNMEEKLDNEITKMNMGKENITVMKVSIIHRQRFLREKIRNYMAILQHYLSIQEGKLINSVSDMSACKLQALVTQEKTLHEFCARCEELSLLIKTLQNDSDSSVIEEKPTIGKLVDGMLSVAQACQINPQAQNTLMFYCNDDIVTMLDKHLGTVGHTDVKGDDQNISSGEDEELMLRNVIENLEKEVFPQQDRGEQPGEHVEVESDEEEEQDKEEEDDDEEDDDEEDDDAEDEEDSSEEEDAEEDGEENEENESRAEAEDDEPTSEGELAGAVGGDMLPEAQQDERPKHEKDINKKQGLLRELQHEIERLRLLGPRGDIIRVVDDTSSSSESENETGDGETRSLQLDLQITVNNDLGGARSKSRATASSTMQGLATAANNRLPRDRKCDPNNHKRKQCSVNCEFHLKPTLKCKKCCRVFCRSCASLSLHCNKSENGHEYVNYGQNCAQPPAKRQKPRKKLQWECKRCTMVNESHVLVCDACETSKDFDPNEVRNVCPMCTLVNEPGKTNCELCDTDLEDCM